MRSASLTVEQGAWPVPWSLVVVHRPQARAVHGSDATQVGSSDNDATS